MKKIFFTGLLVLIDQLTKIIISSFFMGFKKVFHDFIGFTPYLNTSQLSIFNNELDMDLSNVYLSLINVLIIDVLVLLYLYLKKHSNQTSIRNINFMFVFMMAGTSCSLIDKIFWGGSLDYIRILSKIVDLKDIYLVCGLVFYFLWAFSLKPKTKAG